MRRPLWLAGGVAVGVAGTLWAERRVRALAERLSPDHLGAEAVESVRTAGWRVVDAIAAGRDARARREAELWAEMESRPAPRPHPVATRGARRAHRARR